VADVGDQLVLAAATTPLGAVCGIRPPTAQHQIGNEIIMLYNYNLLTRLTRTTFPG